MKVLILGDGILGTELKKQTGWDLVSRKKTGFDIKDINLINKLTHKYDVIVNCIANTNTYSKDSLNHYEINLEFVKKLVKSCNQSLTKLIHISTEFVYANNEIPPTEKDIPIPHSSDYAKSKLLADIYIQSNSHNYLICRTLHKDNSIKYKSVWDIKTTGDFVDKISSLIITLINNNASGLYNVGTGPKNLSDLFPGFRVVKRPNNVPYDTTMNIDKLNNFLKNVSINNNTINIY